MVNRLEGRPCDVVSQYSACATLQFPWKMHVLLEKTAALGQSDIISWLPGGKSFKVHDKERFVREVMPSYFDARTFKSFQRNCNLWGFETRTRGFEIGSVFHESFQRGKPDQCHKMDRSTVKKRDSFSAGKKSANISMPTKPSNDKRIHQVQQTTRDQLDCSQPIQDSFLHENTSQTSNLQRDSLVGLLRSLESTENAPLSSAVSPVSDHLLLEQHLNVASKQSPCGLSVYQQALLGIGEASNHASTRNPLAFHHQLLNYSQAPVGYTDQSGGFNNHTPFQGGSAIQALTLASQHTKTELSNRRNHANVAMARLGVLSRTREHTATETPTTRLPCKARGVPVDHNQRSAFFEITEATKHGEDLTCSHPVCSSKGIKFRYCSVCKVPASRRTFWTLHRHGDEDAAPRKRQRVFKSEVIKEVVAPPHLDERSNMKSESKSPESQHGEAKIDRGRSDQKAMIRECPLPPQDHGRLPLKKRNLSPSTELPLVASPVSNVRETPTITVLEGESKPAGDSDSRVRANRIAGSFERFQSKALPNSVRPAVPTSGDKRIEWLRKANRGGLFPSIPMLKSPTQTQLASSSASLTPTAIETATSCQVIPLD